MIFAWVKQGIYSSYSGNKPIDYATNQLHVTTALYRAESEVLDHVSASTLGTANGEPLLSQAVTASVLDLEDRSCLL